jgi:hypothetical protein
VTNVFKFPRGNRLSARTAVDGLIDEVTAVEIELARARIAQIRSETRQANALWGWWCFKRVVFWGLALWLLTTFAGAANAGDRLPAVYLGHWCLDRDGFYSVIKPGGECVIEPTIIKPNKMLSTELECRFRSIKKISERTVEIVAYCRAVDSPGYIDKMWLTTYSKRTLYFEAERNQ